MDRKNTHSNNKKKNKNFNLNKKSKNKHRNISQEYTIKEVHDKSIDSNTSHEHIDSKSNNEITNVNTNKVVRINSQFEFSNFINTKTLKLVLVFFFAALIALVFRIAYLQFIQGNSLKEKAYNQQVINRIISPKRGDIYDSTGKFLAISAQVDTVTINPQKLRKDDEDESYAYQEKVAKGLSEIFELDYNETLKKVSGNSKVETIAKKVEKDKIDKLKNWMKENNIQVGINIDADTKRYYPYQNVASNVIGFCGTDNQGLSGIESKWDSVLTGTPGKIVSLKGNDQKEIPNAEKSYISAENGSNLTLTIDLHIQSIIEKYLKQVLSENECKKGGNVIVMNPKNGDILGMACYPDYNLNSPYTPDEKLMPIYNSLPDNEKNDFLYKMWSNKSVAETYEPGSVFKVITSAIALEENITTTDKPADFFCKGYEEFQDASSGPLRIKCWKHYNPHGEQSLRDALANSCNPAFMQLGKRIGAETLYKYYDAFGLFNSTNSGLYGEQSSIFQKLENVGPVELATMSFGQRLNVTPLQMANAIACIANDGVLLKPRIVKSITNIDTGAVTEIPVTEVRQVISKQTAKDVRSLMESVVTVGTGKLAAVSGYSIGGKTGTSEPVYDKIDEGYVASYVAISPVEDTQIVLLLTLYDPPKNNHDGGRLASPVVSQMLSEILPYIGIPANTEENSSEINKNYSIVPNIKNKTVAEAEKILKNTGFKTKTYIKGNPNELLVLEQNPKPGSYLAAGSTIVLYAEDNNVATSVPVPNLKGMNLYEAKTTLANSKLNINYEGSGIVVSQDYPTSTQVPEGTIIKLTLKQSITDTH